jgi:FAD/FMN-containing dehydrogenase
MTIFANALAAAIPADRILTQPEAVERVSKDFYWYSPVLEKQLKDKTAEIAVIPKSLDELKAVVALAYEHDIPTTVRGAGTGNYGQAVPLYGGLVIDLSGLDRILEINPAGYVVAEAGARLGSIEMAARKVGWELRCYPSTWVKASVGGFLGGGSGGIGSITYGPLCENQTVRRIEMLTMEKAPRLLTFSGDEIFPVLRTYGTTGIVTKIELALGPRVDWAQLAVAFDSFAACYDFTENFALHSPVRKRLVTCFQAPIPDYFTPLKKFLPVGKAVVFLELDTAGFEQVAASVAEAGGIVVFRQPYSSPRPAPLLSDYTWNHTTLWAIKSNPAYTYLQCGFDLVRAREQFALLHDRFGDDFLLHIEFMKVGGKIVPGSIPVVMFSTEERLNDMIAYCQEIGVNVANPHTWMVDCGARLGPTDPKYVAKQTYDPKALLNPGKMNGYPLPESLAVVA